MEHYEAEKFNPQPIKISDYNSSREYKEEFFRQNILDTVEFYELRLFQSYYTYGFLNISKIFEASKALSESDKSDITYRKINDWSSKALFEENRNANIQWRKYSVRTGVQLLLINDLKKYGYSNEQIKLITNQVIDETIDVSVENHKYSFRFFDFYASTFYKRGISFSILIDGECNAYTLCDKDLISNIADGVNKERPFLILPFSKYLSVFAKYIFSRENESVITKELSAETILHTNEESKIIDKVRDEDVREIKITKKSRQKNALVMTSKKIKDNEYLTDRQLANLVKKNKYSRTTASNVEGNFYNLAIEEIEKLN